MKGMRSHHLTPSRLLRTVGATAAVGLLAIGAVSCGDDDSSSPATDAPTTQAAATVSITGQWARTSPADAANGAAYLTITSPVDDKLVGAKVDASVAGKVEVHETVMADSMGSDTTMAGAMGSDTTMAGAMGSDTTMAGAMGSDTTMAGGMGEMTMRPVEFIELKAGTAVEMKPGGYHIMLFDLVKPLAVGDTIKVTLILEKAGEIVVDVPVLDEAP